MPLGDVDIAAIVAAWGRRQVGPAAQPPSGTIHQTRLVPTDQGVVVLRAYRYAERASVEREHAIIAHARSRGVPAIAPLPLPGGGTILAHRRGFVALFPYAPGRQVAREQLGVAESQALGHMLAEIHRALADLPAGLAAPRQLRIDRAVTLAEITRLERLASAGNHLHDAVVLRALQDQRAYLATLPDTVGVDLSGLPHQAIHGDYTETNVFCESGAVSAVIDWDQGYLAPRAWEVVRTLHLALGLDAALAGPFLAGYHATQPLDWNALDQAAAAYGVMRAHDVWLAQWIYDRGDDRVRRFLTGFAPVAPQWEALQRALR